MVPQYLQHWLISYVHISKRRYGSLAWRILNNPFFLKINISWGIKILCTFFGGHHKIELYLGVISMHFRVFS